VGFDPWLSAFLLCFRVTGRNDFFVLFTTKDTKRTKKVKEPISMMIAFSFVSFVLFVVENAFELHRPFLVAATPRWVHPSYYPSFY